MSYKVIWNPCPKIEMIGGLSFLGDKVVLNDKPLLWKWTIWPKLDYSLTKTVSKLWSQTVIKVKRVRCMGIFEVKNYKEYWMIRVYSRLRGRVEWSGWRDLNSYSTSNSQIVYLFCKFNELNSWNMTLFELPNLWKRTKISPKMWLV